MIYGLTAYTKIEIMADSEQEAEEIAKEQLSKVEKDYTLHFEIKKTDNYFKGLLQGLNVAIAKNIEESKIEDLKAFLITLHKTIKEELTK